MSYYNVQFGVNRADLKPLVKWMVIDVVLLVFAVLAFVGVSVAIIESTVSPQYYVEQN